jgi:hypothetical protein
MSKAPPKTLQNPTHPPDTTTGVRRSTRIRQASSPPVETLPSKAAAQRGNSAQKAAADANPYAEEEDLPPTDSEATALFIIAEALAKLTSRHQMPDHMKARLLNISRYANKMGVKEGKKETIQVSMESVRDLRKSFLADLSSNYSALESKLSNIAANQEQILNATAALTKNTEGINAVAKDIENNVTRVNDATAQIADTTKTYRDALLVQPSQSHGTMVDLKIKDDLERKAKQILVSVDRDDFYRISLTEFKSKAEDAIAAIDDVRDRPEKVEVELVSITRSKAILLQLNSKQAADWLRNPFIESKFTAKFTKDSLFIDRLYNILLPRTPITFEPNNTEHLRELEESNNLDPHSIKKARWIKPINRRREGQTHAYAILSLASPSTANHLIRKGISACGVKMQPTKLKHEPLQCLRCRHWGHMAAQCLSTHDICGACGEEHNTNDCKHPKKRYCVSCKDNTHASWDRGCPEFIRRREIHNNKYPENNLPFFPTDEEWTLTTRPDKIPLEDRFPQRFAVNSIPIKVAPKRTQSQMRNKAKRQNTRAAPPKNNVQNGGANTIVRYLVNTQSTAAAGSSAGEEGELPGPSHLDEPTSNENHIVEQLIGITLPGTLDEWT